MSIWEETPLYAGWMYRHAKGNLGFGAELWLPANQLPDYKAWRALAERQGEDPDQALIGYRMTWMLLHEVTWAAGGVEVELARIRAGMAEAQSWSDEHEGWRAHFIGAPSLSATYYAFVNLLTWTRAVVERVSRQDRGVPAGLLPALASGPLRETLAAAHTTLLEDLGDYRALSNYALHAGGVPGGGSLVARALPDRTLVVALPDVLEPDDAGHLRVFTSEEFSFSGQRDMLTYSENVMAAITRFVDAALTAFEQHGRGQSERPW
jgi:hypothetical protein